MGKSSYRSAVDKSGDTRTFMSAMSGMVDERILSTVK